MYNDFDCKAIDLELGYCKQVPLLIYFLLEYTVLSLIYMLFAAIKCRNNRLSCSLRSFQWLIGSNTVFP